MKRYHQLFIISLLGFLLVSVTVQAQSGSSYELVQSTIGSGGTASGSGYEVMAAIGQAEVGAASGGAYELRGAFWPSESAAVSSPDLTAVYLPVVMR